MKNLKPENRQKVLEAIKTQVETNEPEVTNMTFEKLVKNGIPQEEAYEILGQALVGEMCEMMDEGREFDLDRWSSRLNDL